MMLFTMVFSGEHEGDHFTILQGHTKDQPAHVFGLYGWVTAEGGVMIVNSNHPGNAVTFSTVECYIEQGGGAPLVDRAKWIQQVEIDHQGEKILVDHWSVVLPRDDVPAENELRGGEGMYVPVRRPEPTQEHVDAAREILEAEYDLEAIDRHPGLEHALRHWRHDPDFGATLVPTDLEYPVNLDDPTSYWVDLARTPTGQRSWQWFKFEPNQHARTGGRRTLTGWRHGSAEVWGSGVYSSAHYEHGTGFALCGLQLYDQDAGKPLNDTLFQGWLQQAQRCAMGLTYSGNNRGWWVDEKDGFEARGTHNNKDEPSYARAKQFHMQAHVWEALTGDPQITQALDVSAERLLTITNWNGSWGARIPANDGLDGLRWAYQRSGDERFSLKAEDYGRRVMDLPSRRPDGLWPNMGNKGAAETSPWMQAKLLRALWRWHKDHGLWPGERDRLLDTMEALWELGTYDVVGAEPDPDAETHPQRFLEPSKGSPYYQQEFEPVPYPEATDGLPLARVASEDEARARWGGEYSVAVHNVRPALQGADALNIYRAMRYRFREEDGFWVGRGPTDSTNPQLGAWGLACWSALAGERGEPWGERLAQVERTVYDTIGSSWGEVIEGVFYDPHDVGWEWAPWGWGGASKRWLTIKEGMRR